MEALAIFMEYYGDALFWLIVFPGGFSAIAVHLLFGRK